ncbi:hypothetical protein GP475_05575 [Corynebacterium poyangense]|uniref:Uncharacterized protein n=1 Tax=Corynebacterium poyangense TaxID=2684405 RepID=A0A7H0SS95_9CORY|nr:hypothetical protein [Corynebacterium poyangense]QNQ91420.1 hypothetical protein GP475_05575 [Corynebacterium poyangense]
MAVPKPRDPRQSVITPERVEERFREVLRADNREAESLQDQDEDAGDAAHQQRLYEQLSQAHEVLIAALQED